MHLLSDTCAEEVAALPQHAAVPTIYVVDDDPSIRTAIARLLAAEQHTVATFDSAEAFLEQHDRDAAGCIVLDIMMAGLSGIDLQQHLVDRGNEMPIIFLTGYADVRTGVRAMKCGAVDFLMKPVEAATLLAAVAQALRKAEARRQRRAEREATERRLSTLTRREREVLTHVLAGRLNKQIASDLGTVEQTIKVHRARVMEKMRVRSIAELARIMERAQARSFV